MSQKVCQVLLGLCHSRMIVIDACTNALRKFTYCSASEFASARDIVKILTNKFSQ
jgi:hypothetical protein